jgi:late competence protein required for DNA uptake (superfamily II DNA/RNA helicase)
MARNFPRTGKKVRPKTAVKGKRLHCAKCRKRSPKPIKTLAPWYCPNCLKENDATTSGIESGKRASADTE